jgi:hypothetical protein
MQINLNPSINQQQPNFKALNCTTLSGNPVVKKNMSRLTELAKNVDWLWWLSYGENFGLEEPLTLDLNVIKISFALMFKINIASIIGIALGIFIYRKV